jgi:hypothetical protein
MKKVKVLIATLEEEKPKWNFTLDDFNKGNFPWLLPQSKIKYF